MKTIEWTEYDGPAGVNVGLFLGVIGLMIVVVWWMGRRRSK